MDEDTRRRAATDEAKQLLRLNTQQALEEGVFGVPSMTVDGEVFWGLDSFPHLEQYLAGEDPLDQVQLKKWESLPASATRT
jgi:2-hydroxychromene-2-carboxylate isomerase